MVAPLRSWLLLSPLITLRASATKRSITKVPLEPWTADIDTELEGITAAHIQPRAADVDPELESWLGALQREPAAKLCPESCSEVADWSVFPDPASLAACNETMLLKAVVRNDADTSQDTHLGIRACTADYSLSTKPVFTPDEEKAALCPTHNTVLLDVPVTLSSYVGDVSEHSFSAQHLLSAGRQILEHWATQQPSCTENVLSFGYSQSALVGVFAGAEIHQHGIPADLLSRFLQYVEETPISRTTIVQLCDSDSRGADYGFGIIVGSTANFALVMETLKTWTDGVCVSDGIGNQKDWTSVTIRIPKAESTPSNSTSQDDTTTPANPLSRSRVSVLNARAECRTTKVQSGDGCWALADRCKISQADLVKYNTRKNFCTTLVIGELVCCSSGTLPETIPPGNSDGTCKTREVVSGDICDTIAPKCGISVADFKKVNPQNNFCTTLKVGQPVCCTRGKLPDLRPKPKSNGFCFDYTIKPGDDCSIIAARRTMTVANLESFNKNTWGWNGCDPLYANTKICLSTGTPPMPAIDPLAICGPTVNGTVQPPAGTNISSLNPCPLNACCNVWGNCGLTSDFCNIERAASGAPGTSAPKKNSCIYNCGMNIVKGSPPAKKINVAYFEAWNGNRACLKMDVDQIDTKRYTHIHFAFIDITRDFKIDASKFQMQFAIFKQMTGIKKIVSFGGWDFSTLPGTFHILREAVLPKNRALFVSNIVNFFKTHNLDGVDVDWEYPGAPDIPDIPPPANPVEGMNYYQTLVDIKKQLGSDKSVSFAAPASFHYLKSFPMKKMGESLDYIVYMTYDIHGQWDYGNKWTTPGCPSGNCLRSHVNETETKDALAMITKAGVPSGKIVVGVSSYGRSFKMAQAGCDGPNCKYTGSSRASNALKGRCTNTAGYISNAEINEIIKSGKVTRQWKTAGSNILVYNSTEWVGYMNEDTKKERAAFYASYNFAGTTDWAVDLQEFVPSYGDLDDIEPVIRSVLPQCGCKHMPLKELEARKNSLPKHCIDKYIYDAEIAVMQGALDKYKKLVDGGYDKKFRTYERYIQKQAPEQFQQFMNDNGKDYFKCTETKIQICCSQCNFATCLEQCNKSTTCRPGKGTNDIACPASYGGAFPPSWGAKIPNATFILKDKDGFYKKIYDDYGIEKGWVAFATVLVRPYNGCQFQGMESDECLKERSDHYYDYPVVGVVNVFNPKSIIGNGYTKSQDLLRRMKIWQNNADFDSELSWAELADAGALPAFAMEEAVANMDKIIEKATEIEKQEREAFILNFINGLLFFIPFIGSSTAAGLSSLRGMISLIGAAGEAGMLVYSIVQDPESGLMAVLSALTGAGVGRAGFRDAANFRRGLSSNELKALGPVKDRLASIDRIRGAMCPA
ncbi:putative glycosyl hydrolase, family 18 [Stachybotrys elegans]|uniref:chitinase n=1 Tax=Stachybotrys elegans TaxID=80388 RepID=A0A8K0SS15_9HYPO|nr:putative glycosyl hydrolase, family 18 [Stachybotrys elegans]